MSRKHVIVTGGSRGLGASMIEGLLEDGYMVSTCSRKMSDNIQALLDTLGTRLLREKDGALEVLEAYFGMTFYELLFGLWMLVQEFIQLFNLG